MAYLQVCWLVGWMLVVHLERLRKLKLLDLHLSAQKLAGLTLRGVGPLWLGARPSFKITAAVKTALDAENRFPGLDD